MVQHPTQAVTQYCGKIRVMVNCTAMQQAPYPTTLANYKRADPLSIIIVDAQGNCVHPNTSLVEDAFETNSTDDWSFADVGPRKVHGDAVANGLM